MKKLVSMALVGAMAFSLLACGSNKAPDSSGSSTSGGDYSVAAEPPVLLK